MKLVSPPTAEQQIHFLQQLRRILGEGSFTASYKFALLHALADLCVLKGDDSGAELVLSSREIAEQMIELYWRQTKPFPASRGEPQVLQQNIGRKAKILSEIEAVQQEYGPSLQWVRQQPDAWERLVREVDRVVRVMPLWKLQTVGQERLDFLYENEDASDSVTLRLGVAYCFRAFYDLITDLVRGSWLRYVRRYNAPVLGETSDLSTFLFGSERASLAVYSPILLELQEGRCFYCRKNLRGGIEVDHFVPWAMYPVDLGHNFVLADGPCNRQKSDNLAAEPFLERWLVRNEEHRSLLIERFERAGAPHDATASLRVAEWGYAQTARIGSQVWGGGRSLVPLSTRWETLFRAHDPSIIAQHGAVILS
ncbi:MAG: HNH endonuclease [Gemmatimonadetes bacterium]|jgi:hypothetical protein|nr:HNH endonuclease [Gemmatimonadota bacterium]